jgi:hypothetical protein
MATTAPAQMHLGGAQGGQSAWHHATSTYGGMGAQTAGANGAIALKGGRRRQSKRQSRRQSRKVDRRQRRQSKRQRGGRR